MGSQKTEENLSNDDMPIGDIVEKAKKQKEENSKKMYAQVQQAYNTLSLTHSKTVEDLKQARTYAANMLNDLKKAEVKISKKNSKIKKLTKEVRRLMAANTSQEDDLKALRAAYAKLSTQQTKDNTYEVDKLQSKLGTVSKRLLTTSKQLTQVCEERDELKY